MTKGYTIIVATDENGGIGKIKKIWLFFEKKQFILQNQTNITLLLWDAKHGNRFRISY